MRPGALLVLRLGRARSLRGRVGKGTICEGGDTLVRTLRERGEGRSCAERNGTDSREGMERSNV